MYVHVPTAWCAMLVLTWSFVCASMFLITGRISWDHRWKRRSLDGCRPLLSAVGAGRNRDNRRGGYGGLGSPAHDSSDMLMVFLGITALRRFAIDPVKRATWSSVATVIEYIDVPIVYFSVKWWNSIHQQQSNLSSLSRDF